MVTKVVTRTLERVVEVETIVHVEKVVEIEVERIVEVAKVVEVIVERIVEVPAVLKLTPVPVAEGEPEAVTQMRTQLQAAAQNAVAADSAISELRVQLQARAGDLKILRQVLLATRLRLNCSLLQLCVGLMMCACTARRASCLLVLEVFAPLQEHSEMSVAMAQVVQTLEAKNTSAALALDDASTSEAATQPAEATPSVPSANAHAGPKRKPAAKQKLEAKQKPAAKQSLESQPTAAATPQGAQPEQARVKGAFRKDSGSCGFQFGSRSCPNRLTHAALRQHREPALLAAAPCMTYEAHGCCATVDTCACLQRPVGNARTCRVSSHSGATATG